LIHGNEIPNKVVQGDTLRARLRLALDEMNIESIADNMHFADTIGRWHWNEWGHADPDGNMGAWISSIAERSARDEIPTSYVALSESKELLGSVSLVDCDMDTRSEFWPWLAGLFVSPDARNGGVGSALTVHATNSVRKMGAKKLYLYTSTAESLYRRLGWTVIDRDYYEGDDVAIMSILLD
jgi:GNAT superfamily N-acetyltransferase